MKVTLNFADFYEKYYQGVLWEYLGFGSRVYEKNERLSADGGMPTDADGDLLRDFWNNSACYLTVVLAAWNPVLTPLGSDSLELKVTPERRESAALAAAFSRQAARLVALETARLADNSLDLDHRGRLAAAIAAARAALLCLLAP